MKIACMFVVCVLVLGGCNTKTEDLEKKNSELSQESSKLAQELSTRDKYIDQITASISDVYNSLEGMQAKEKLLQKEMGVLEGNEKLTSQQVRQKLLDKITAIGTTMKDNQKKLADLKANLASYGKQFVGFQKMIHDLENRVQEREKSIARLQERVNGLQTDLAEKTEIVKEKDSVITLKDGEIQDKTARLNTAYYIIGKRDELEQKGIIRKEGGFLWGLLGSTTILSNGLDKGYFKPIDKTKDNTIAVDGKIVDIIPKREDIDYKMDDRRSSLTILQPSRFWENNFLVIVTD